MAPLDAATRALLRQRHQRQAHEPWRLPLALVIVLLLHGLFFGVVWYEMRPPSVHRFAAVRLDNALRVRFVDRPHAVVATTPPPLAHPPSPRSPSHASPAMAGRNADSPAAVPPPVAVARPQLFDRTGQPLLPPPATRTTAAPAPGYVQHLPQGDTQVMRHDSPIDYKATRFEAYFPPADETILGEGLRRALHATHTGENAKVDLPGGLHLKCKTLFGIPTPECVNPPPPPSRKDGDERLNMAPAAPLAKEMRPVGGPGVARCIAIYRAGKPLPHGCPVDTPIRAVDAECIEQYRAGKPLAAHCDLGTLRRAAAGRAPADGG